MKHEKNFLQNLKKKVEKNIPDKEAENIPDRMKNILPNNETESVHKVGEKMINEESENKDNYSNKNNVNNDISSSSSGHNHDTNSNIKTINNIHNNNIHNNNINNYCSKIIPDSGTCVKESSFLGFRCFPSFLIIGTMKSGTGELMNWLNKHPNLQSGE